MKYLELPKELRALLLLKHTHAELCKGDEVVYKEQDVIDIIEEIQQESFNEGYSAGSNNSQL